MPGIKPSRRFLLCIDSEGYPASLEVRKVYQVLPDEVAESRGFVRIIDESGEDYLYPANYFVAIDLPLSAATAFAATP